MNKFHTVFLAAMLTAGTTMATDSRAKIFAMEKINNPAFLSEKNHPSDQFNKELLGKNNFTEQVLNILKNQNEEAEKVKSTIKAMEILKETGRAVKNAMRKIVDSVAQTSEDAVKQAKSELPGAVEKAKEMGESMAKTFMKYMKKMMSFITNSFKEMLGKDESKGQKMINSDDEFRAAVSMGYESDSTQDTESDSTNTSMNQKSKDPNQENKHYKAMLDTMAQEG